MIANFLVGALLQRLPDTQGVRVVRIIAGIGALVMVAVILFRRHRESPVLSSPGSHSPGALPHKQAPRPFLED